MFNLFILNIFRPNTTSLGFCFDSKPKATSLGLCLEFMPNDISSGLAPSPMIPYGAYFQALAYVPDPMICHLARA